METTEKTKKVLYTGRTHTTGGRERGVSRSSDGNLDVRLSMPGSGGTGTNPEQLFAAAWSACFEGAMGIAARKMRVNLPEETFIDAEVDLTVEGGQHALQARLNIGLPGLDRDVADTLVHYAHSICPYSKAIYGNVPVSLNLI